MSKSAEINPRRVNMRVGLDLDAGSVEFLEAFLEKIKGRHFNPDDLVFSGFDGIHFLRGGQGKPREYIYGMNEAAWRRAIDEAEQTPPEFAEHWPTPTVGLYDRHQLSFGREEEIRDDWVDEHTWSGGIDHVVPAGYLSDSDDTLGFGKIVLTDFLGDLEPSTPMEENFVHKEYPDRNATDALLGLVFIKRV